jgi:hypothetical protein
MWGVYLYIPFVPNFTHVTQETDQYYGLFKTIQRRNKLTKHRLFSKSETLAIMIADLVLFTFGGDIDEDTTGHLMLENAFVLPFSNEHNLAVWSRKVGAIPLTRSCLDAPEVVV